MLPRHEPLDGLNTRLDRRWLVKFLAASKVTCCCIPVRLMRINQWSKELELFCAPEQTRTERAKIEIYDLRSLRPGIDW